MKAKNFFKSIEQEVEEEYGSLDEFFEELPHYVPVTIGDFTLNKVDQKYVYDGENIYKHLVVGVSKRDDDSDKTTYYRLTAIPGDSWTGEGYRGFSKSQMVEVKAFSVSVVEWREV